MSIKNCTNDCHKHLRRGMASTKTMTALAGGLIALLIVIGIFVKVIGGGGQGPGKANGQMSVNDLDTLEGGLIGADKALNADELDEAERIINRLLELFPNEPDVVDRHVQLLLYQRKHAEAYDELVRLSGMVPSNPEVEFNAGALASQLNKLEEAAAHFNKASMLDASDERIPLYWAQVLIKQHKYDEAKVQLLRVIGLDANSHHAQGTMAEIYLIQNQPELAAQHVARARTLDPSFLKWRLVEARVLRRQNKPREAITLLAATGSDDRYHPELIAELATCWAAAGEPTKAAEANVELLNQGPDEAYALRAAVDAAKYYLIAGNEEQARRWLNYARGIAPDLDEIKRLSEQLDG